MEFIGILCLILVTTSLAAHICRRVGVPGVVGQLLIGIGMAEIILQSFISGKFEGGRHAIRVEELQ